MKLTEAPPSTQSSSTSASSSRRARISSPARRRIVGSVIAGKLQCKGEFPIYWTVTIMDEKNPPGPLMDIDELIARRLAALRKERELTLAQLAERCAVSKAMISRIERNQSSPTASVLGRLAGGLGSPSPSCSATRRHRPNRSAGARSRKCGKTRPAATAAARSALAIRAAAARWWKWRSRRTPASTIPAGAAGSTDSACGWSRCAAGGLRRAVVPPATRRPPGLRRRPRGDLRHRRASLPLPAGDPPRLVVRLFRRRSGDQSRAPTRCR